MTRFSILVLTCLIPACGAITQKDNLNSASLSTSPEDPRTSVERRVLIFAAYWRQDEQEELIDRRRDRYFLSLARDALDRHVRGSACRWLISSAKMLQEGLNGVLYTPDYFEPSEMEALKDIASLDARTICPRPTKTN